ncbi:glycine--tRNA ligase subunit beta [Niveibacterium sp. 24ML]|uniref:glycine--tRNA ligase subunit beta n=1 Tax=Niveibacterium sp. 24ML TaxID=2985512 RepID=UPI00226E803D|nr:glycine--tRNA ligase subunit beta [Niveibacterium sp. 24ML]MCX9157720.1 glycine--tRNA ligase subunit beta [Niveibacterium sp. 24ML]
MQDTLLVELLTEELPPKALARLGEAFADGIVKGLVAHKLVGAAPEFQAFASPRRLAVTVSGVAAQAADAQVREKIMPVSVALTADGTPSPALLKKLEAKGISADAVAGFERAMDGKSETFFHTMTVPGASLDSVLAGIVGESVKKLPIPKVMRWGDSTHQFVRPVHGLIQLHGSRVVPGEVLGLAAGNTTRGHRFLGEGAVTVESAEAYARTLFEKGSVVASFEARRSLIAQELAKAAAQVGAHPVEDAALLDEVTALVEHPTVYVGEFEAEFLAVPQECLILTMKQNQKYFPLLDAAGKLINKFLIVANIKADIADNITGGNARVVRARLSDAKFFFDTDRKAKIDSRLPRLANVVYHNKLGSVLDRIGRIEALAGKIAARLHADVAAAQRAARLAKADLVTEMVGEFPELQGIMGEYYARHDGEGEVVAQAIEQHYHPRFAGDSLPQGNVACAVALADKLDALVGFYAIGEKPTGDKDPFGLRRAALGALRILIEAQLPLELNALLADAAVGFAAEHKAAESIPALVEFIGDRLRNLLREQGTPVEQVDAVLAALPARVSDVPAKLAAVAEFVALPEAAALAAANKRIVNILKKAEGAIGEIDVALLVEPAEKALAHAVIEAAPLQRSLIENADYTGSLKALAELRGAVDTFFEEVMVNHDEPLIRANRLALLKQLAGMMNAVADISRLSV